jgi:hypothetical protein
VIADFAPISVEGSAHELLLKTLKGRRLVACLVCSKETHAAACEMAATLGAPLRDEVFVRIQLDGQAPEVQRSLLKVRPLEIEAYHWPPATEQVPLPYLMIFAKFHGPYARIYPTDDAAKMLNHARKAVEDVTRSFERD